MELSGETILVADDDPYIGKVLTDRLEALGHRVLLAASGKGVLELLERHDPQVALLDIGMADITGIEVLKEIRRRGRDFPIVMITAYQAFQARPYRARHSESHRAAKTQEKGRDSFRRDGQALPAFDRQEFPNDSSR
ncbi:MAG: response regulator [Deltaproteobacteria bacterium]|nr:MAG: response regulator [Deltaproteobacteria bacterium]